MQKGGVQVSLGDIKGFAVHPKDDCPHVKVQHINATHKLLDTLRGLILPGVCKDCASKQENWICLVCNGVFCSRYVKGHMSEHNAQTKHEVALSFTDGSIWCYDCESYITSTPLTMLQIKFSSIKFPDGDDKVALEELTEAFERNLKIDNEKKEQPKFNMNQGKEKQEKEQKEKNEQKQIEKEKEIQKEKYTRERFVKDLKDKTAKNIVFLTGAGISVSAGIPDFRSPNTGLYSKLAKYGLSSPQAIFQITSFKDNPEPFYKLSKELFSAKILPTVTHKFIKKLNEYSELSRVITQNIDSLELQAGLPEHKLIQAHGHSRSARCLDCKKNCDIKEFNECIEKEEVMRCFCGGFVKPDVVFFGEQLPKQFEECPQIMSKADMVIIMGTSLVVFPFALLIDMVDKNIPVILINNTNSLKKGFPNTLWLDGDLDEQVRKLAKDLELEI